MDDQQHAEQTDVLDIEITDEPAEAPAAPPEPVAPPETPAPAEAVQTSGDDDTLVVDFDAGEDVPAAIAAAVPPAPSLDDVLPPGPMTVGSAPAPEPAADALVVDLDAEPLPGLSSARPADALEIDADDLFDGPTTLPGFQGGPMAEKMVGVKAAPTGVRAAARNVLPQAIAGLLGGLVGWLFSEPAVYVGGQSLASLVGGIALYAGIVGACIGIALGIAYGLAMGVPRKAWHGALVGLLFGGIGGAVGGGLAQLVYGSVNLSFRLGDVGQLFVRAVGWSMMAVVIGMGQAALVPAEKKMRNGILGGALGGFVGGAALQLIKLGFGSAPIGRCLALCVMGLAIGLLIAMVEEAAKEAWLHVVGGPLQGKQFILYETRTLIGSNQACQIMLFKDPQVSQQHAAIDNERTSFRLTQLDPGASTFVNGRPVSRCQLEDGDVIGIGNSLLEFHERVSGAAGKGAPGSRK